MNILRPKSTTNSSSKNWFYAILLLTFPVVSFFQYNFSSTYFFPLTAFTSLYMDARLNLNLNEFLLISCFNFDVEKIVQKKENLVSRFFSPKFAVNRLNFAFLRQKIENPATGFVAANQCDQMGRLLFSKFCHIKR